MQNNGQNRPVWTVIFLIAACLRAGILAVDLYHFHHLHEDRDAYLDIARQVAQGKGYSLSETGEPTAFRPPLYPLILAGIELTGTGVYGIAFFQFILGMLTVWLTYKLARKLLPEYYAIGAMALVAVDPLLLQYSTFVMTETLFVFLFLWLVSEVVSDKNSDELKDLQKHLKKFRIGLLFGLCALCRPTVWAFGILWLMTHLYKVIKHKIQQKPVTLISWSMALGILLLVAPWMYRNWVVLEKPIFTTTHGGYTLLLGNNSVFYRDVVDKKWGTVWKHDSLKKWQGSLEDEMKKSPEPVKTEPQKDQWMYRKAFEEIRNDPKSFLSACWLRFRRFWNVAPTGEATSGIPDWIQFGVGIYYLMSITGMVVGIVRLRSEEWRIWFPLILACIAFMGVHLFYWTNMRMRAPLLPLICILFMRGILPRYIKTDE